MGREEKIRFKDLSGWLKTILILSTIVSVYIIGVLGFNILMILLGYY